MKSALMQYKDERDVSEKRHYHALESVRLERQQTRDTFLQGDPVRETRPAAELTRIKTASATEILLPATPSVLSRMGGQSSAGSRSSSALGSLEIGSSSQVLRLGTGTPSNRAQIRNRPRTQSSAFSAESPVSQASGLLSLVPSSPNTNVGQSLRWSQGRNPSLEGDETNLECPSSSFEDWTTVYKPPESLKTLPLRHVFSPEQKNGVHIGGHWSSWYHRQLDGAEGGGNNQGFSKAWLPTSSYDALETRLRSRERTTRTVSFQDYRFGFRDHEHADRSMHNSRQSSESTGVQQMARARATSPNANFRVAWSEPGSEQLCPYPYAAKLVFARRSC